METGLLVDVDTFSSGAAGLLDIWLENPTSILGRVTMDRDELINSINAERNALNAAFDQQIQDIQNAKAAFARMKTQIEASRTSTIAKRDATTVDSTRDWLNQVIHWENAAIDICTQGELEATTQETRLQNLKQKTNEAFDRMLNNIKQTVVPPDPPEVVDVYYWTDDEPILV